MPNSRISQWLSLAANIGVIVGIAFVVLEIRQNSDIATAQMRLDYAAGWRSIDEQRQDEAFARVFVRSVVRPGELSLEEIVQLDGYYVGVVDQMLSAYTVLRAGLGSGRFEGVARQVAKTYFSNEYAQSWWRHSRHGWAIADTADFQRIMDEAIGAAGIRGNLELFEGIQRSLSPGSGLAED